MNKTIRHSSIFALLLVLILLVYLTFVQGFSEERLAQSQYNPRGFYEAKEIARGQISTDGQVLASSSADEDGLYQRSYPTMPVSFSPVVGYLSDRFGAAGLEAGYNGVLSGQDSSIAASRWLDDLTGKQKRGANLELTLDTEMQDVAYSWLVDNGYDGAAVAMRPSTGEVLAMASTPAYNPNDVVNPATADETWAAINNDPGQPLINSATQETLPPGSIYKIITTAAGLDAGYTPSSTVTGQASITLPNTNTQLTNYAGQTCGGSNSVSLETAFALSCNTAFVEMAIDAGADAMRTYATAFGVGETYDLGLPTSPGSLGELPDAAAVGQSAIGQRDVTMSALQAAVMAATVANDGLRMAPYLVDQITAPDLEVLRTTEPREITQAVTPEQATTLENLMFASERNTSGYDGNGFASKTGTAEHADDAAPHVWYVAYDPANDVAVSVVVKNGGGFGSSATGGQVAAPIGRAILNAAPRGGA